MADNLETPDFGNFSIQSTMEGMGSQELLSDLLGPDTSTVKNWPPDCGKPRLWMPPDVCLVGNFAIRFANFVIKG